ncbi:MAG: SET domain-containing protein-lysine N-methyltransferase [Deltaproteobacteria bacterium]|nr:SET domain-containing protein-lysine N-methyltransferase [Deltaproteobacteria bacterium]
MSCNPNAGIKGNITFVALKNIRKDKEITFDYSISEHDVFWKMKCCCEQRGCRKIISSIQFLPIKTFKKYLPYIPTYFKKVYLKKYHKNL